MANLNTKTLSAGVTDILAVSSGTHATTFRQVKDGSGGDTPIYLTESKLGIGDATPSNLFAISSTTGPQFRITHTDDTDYATFAVDGDGQLDITTVDGGGAGGHICLIPDGNVGMGTTTPVSSLEIQAGLTTVGAVLTLATKEPSVVANDVLGRINFYAPLDTGVDSDVTGASISAVAQDTFSDTVNSTALHFQTGKSEDATGTTASMVIDEDGKVGIGTTDPSDILTVHGNFKLNTTSGDGNESRFKITPGGSGDDCSVLVYDDNQTAMIKLDGAGKIGIGTTSPNQELEVVGDISVLRTDVSATRYVGIAQPGGTMSTSTAAIGFISDGTDQEISFSTHKSGSSAGERMRISAHGYVGIGDTAPTMPLSIDRGLNGLLIQGYNSASSGNVYGQKVKFTGQAPDNNTSYFLSCEDSGKDCLKIYSDGDIQNHDNAYGSMSDERIKQDIRDANSQWDDIKALKVRNFKRKDDVAQYGDKAWEQIGVIAQEVESAGMDKLINHSPPSQFEIDNCGIAEDGMVKSMKYSVLYMKAVKALQEAMLRIETLETKVTTLENK